MRGERAAPYARLPEIGTQRRPRPLEFTEPSNAGRQCLRPCRASFSRLPLFRPSFAGSSCYSRSVGVLDAASPYLSLHQASTDRQTNGPLTGRLRARLRPRACRLPPRPPAASGACPSDWLSDWSSPPGRQPPAALLSSQRTSDRVTDSRPSSPPAASPGQLFKPLSSAPLLPSTEVASSTRSQHVNARRPTHKNKTQVRVKHLLQQ